MKELIEKHKQGDLSDSDLIYCVYEFLFSKTMRDTEFSCYQKVKGIFSIH